VLAARYLVVWSTVRRAHPRPVEDHKCAPRKVASVKKGLHAVAANARLQRVSPHMLRHSAAVHMAEAGISMEEIAQFLGHSSVEVTRKVYARFSPTYLRKAASVLEYDDLGSMNQGELPKSHVSA